MAKVKLNFTKFSVTEKIARARLIVEKITANAANFPTPVPPLAEVTAAIDAAEAAYNAALEARAVSKQKTAVLEKTEDALDGFMSRVVSYVDTASGGKEEIILSAGLDVREPSITSDQPMSAPTGLVLTMGDIEGSLDAAWNADPRASSYVVQITTDPQNASSWKQADIVTKSSTTIKGLTGGVKYWVRVAAVGPTGQSAWSDPAVRMAP